jgi:hypothetical protein
MSLVSFLRLSKSNFVGCGSRSTALPNTFANVEWHAATSALHLAAQIRFTPWKLIDDPTDTTIQLRAHRYTSSRCKSFRRRVLVASLASEPVSGRP